MAILNIALADGETRTITQSDTGGDADNTININGLGNSELIVDGTSATLGSILDIQAGASPTFTATNGGSLTVDQGLLNVSGLDSFSFGIEGNSDITLDASSISTLSGLSDYNVDFSGAESGSFTFNKPDVGLLDSYSFNVTGMEAGDGLNLGGGDWSLDEGALGTQDAYRDGALHITQGSALAGTQVNASIEMSSEQYAEFEQDPEAFLSGGTFTQVCFAAGTMIATPEGEKAVETLTTGDMVLTASGAQVPVKWIGLQTMSRMKAGSQAPVRIREGALGADNPTQDLIVTPSHGMIIDGLVINAGALVNGDTIDYVPHNELPDTVTYYHVETDSHEVIMANGSATETYVDYITRQAFDNYAEYVALYGIETRVIEMPRPRISSRRLLPMALRQRLGIQDAFMTA
ncbi:Hint domain-containing protein [Halomonas organivorans]|uniref:Hedgehog/Intein (Hint) domain-containing protein n=1 Tax=Halomonas organivorans TaxID=257772 RepID=A0A7W5C0T8_9GAMM|nr:Hint domain-containing protein [Halomonas organivorans]MBB3142635.1 hypothetical protein [Halomonas organivorans]